MIIRNIYRQDILAALAVVNAVFDNNIKYKRLDFVANSRGGGQTFAVTLTCKDSRAPGSRHNLAGRRISAACWHAHGLFHDSLPPDTLIKSSYAMIGTNKQPGDSWEDWRVQYGGRRGWMSDTCDCGPFDYIPPGGFAPQVLYRSQVVQ